MPARREVLVSSAARTSSSNSGVINFRQDNFTAALLLLDVTAASGTNPTLDIYIQQELPDAATFHDVARFSQVTGTGKRFISWVACGPGQEGAVQDAAMSAGVPKQAPLGGKWRVKWVIAADADPSFTFAVYGDLFY